ncbi:hypothetical protein MMC06_004064 [Schaereria dolodes]|nr:hypothetical protein [Schaereria dolodes]
MWLDRLSSQSASASSLSPLQNKSHPSATRRPSHLSPKPAARTPFSPRSSSLSLASKVNASTSSLTGASRAPNGSTLKNQVSPPGDFDDPLAILSSIVGSSLPKDNTNVDHFERDGILTKPERLVVDVSFNGSSLQEFVQNSYDEQEQEVNGSTYYRSEPVEEYDQEKDKFEDLHSSILACDDVLKSVELSLTSFQKDLGLVSAEIETLQNRSMALNTKLENRKVVDKLLGPAVEEISISPVTVGTISEGQIDENWLKALSELEKRSKVVENKIRGSATIRAAKDIKPLLDDLIAKAVERIRDFLVAQIKALRSPNINAQILQQQMFLRFKDIYGFLARHHPQLAEEISQAYINTMRWYYLNHFTRYRQALDKIALYTVDKSDSLGDGLPANKQSQRARDPINIGRRTDILRVSNQSAISSYLAEEDKTMHHMEVPFRNFNLALIDNVSAEYSFLTEFFHHASFNHVSRIFAEIFEPTFSLGQSLVKDLIENTFDCLGILLCVRLNQHSAFELQRRKVPVADGYVNGVNMLLWPRFQLSMDAYCESIRRFAAGLSTRSTTPALSFTGSSDPTRQSTAPHQLTQRFGQFIQSLLAISNEAGDDEPVSSSLRRLRGEYEAFLMKASKGVGSDGKKRERFLSNNYALILTIVADTEGKLAHEQKQHFEEMRDANREH